MYTLSLTGNEVRAILFVARRGYSEAVADAILSDATCDVEIDDMEPKAAYTFQIPEHKAWAIQSEEEDNGGHGFGPVSNELTAKLYALVGEIV